MACGHQFRTHKCIDAEELWRLYQGNKQTVMELAASYGVSPSTIKRRLRGIERVWEQPALHGSGFVHLDATYWGRGHGILLAIDDKSGKPLHLSFIENERTADYREAIDGIERRGYAIRGIIIDGKQSLFTEFSAYKIQMCQFHMKQIVRRYITLNPRLRAARALLALMDGLPKARKEDFEREYAQWKSEWHDVLYRRTMLKSGKSGYTHRRLRSAMHSIDFYLPYLFTYQEPDCEGMPNTNNKIEGTFTDLKKNLNNHSGMSDESRRRFVSGFFLAWEEKLT